MSGRGRGIRFDPGAEDSPSRGRSSAVAVGAGDSSGGGEKRWQARSASRGRGRLVRPGATEATAGPRAREAASRREVEKEEAASGRGRSTRELGAGAKSQRELRAGAKSQRERGTGGGSSPRQQTMTTLTSATAPAKAPPPGDDPPLAASADVAAAGPLHLPPPSSSSSHGDDDDENPPPSPYTCETDGEGGEGDGPSRRSPLPRPPSPPSAPPAPPDPELAAAVATSGALLLAVAGAVLAVWGQDVRAAGTGRGPLDLAATALRHRVLPADLWPLSMVPLGPLLAAVLAGFAALAASTALGLWRGGAVSGERVTAREAAAPLPPMGTLAERIATGGTVCLDGAIVVLRAPLVVAGGTAVVLRGPGTLRAAPALHVDGRRPFGLVVRDPGTSLTLMDSVILEGTGVLVEGKATLSVEGRQSAVRRAPGTGLAASGEGTRVSALRFSIEGAGEQVRSAAVTATGGAQMTLEDPTVKGPSGDGVKACDRGTTVDVRGGRLVGRLRAGRGGRGRGDAKGACGVVCSGGAIVTLTGIEVRQWPAYGLRGDMSDGDGDDDGGEGLYVNPLPSREAGGIIHDSTCVLEDNGVGRAGGGVALR